MIQNLLKIVIVLVAISGVVDAAVAGEKKRQPNVLFIAVDDLRPELNCYGNTHIKSPYIDKLAERGTLFMNAYCQQAVCSPSRTSIMTGLRPDSTRVYDLQTHFRKNIPNVVTLSQHFKKHGYASVGYGKIYHGGLDDGVSWSEKFEPVSAPSYFLQKNIDFTNARRREAREKGLRGKELKNFLRPPPFENAPVDESRYRDYQIASAGIKRMGELSKAGKPFFMAVGFLKPHLPFNAPKKYWDMYDRDEIKVPSRKKTRGIPDYAVSSWGELRSYHGMPASGEVSDAQAKELIHGYYACVSFIDAQVGRLERALGELGIADNTIVVLWGDHGWKLGDYGSWCKHTNYELDTRVPLIMATPWQKEKGTACDGLVEFVDMYPTLVELAGLPGPGHLEGTSFARLLDDPLLKWKSAAFSQYPRTRRAGGERTHVMGYSMRTRDFHLVRWVKREWPARPNGEAYDVELYDHRVDRGELNNVADDEQYADVLRKLNEQYRAGWKGARPK